MMVRLETPEKLQLEDSLAELFQLENLKGYKGSRVVGAQSI
jgi:hypothetical protein